MLQAFGYIDRVVDSNFFKDLFYLKERNMFWGTILYKYHGPIERTSKKFNNDCLYFLDWRTTKVTQNELSSWSTQRSHRLSRYSTVQYSPQIYILCVQEVIYIVSYKLKWVTTSWTHSTKEIDCKSKGVMDRKVFP